MMMQTKNVEVTEIRGRTPILALCIFLATASTVYSLPASAGGASAVTRPSKSARRGQARASNVNWIIRDTAEHDRPLRLDFVGVAFPWWIGGAAWFSIPIVPDGFIPAVNDSFDIEFGSYFLWWYGGADFFSVVPLGGVRWKFHLTPSWTVFGSAKLGVQVGLGRRNRDFVAFHGEASAGAYWHFGERVNLRLEIGNWGLLQVGMSILL